MGLKEPQSMEECIYYTQRNIGAGKARAWVFKEKCPKCKGALMGKPVDSKGKIKIRAKEYICPKCNYTVEKQAYEDTLTCNIQYVCPQCKFSGETQVPYKRKKVDGIPTIQAECQKCKAKISITKKMKQSGESDEGDE